MSVRGLLLVALSYMFRLLLVMEKVTGNLEVCLCVRLLGVSSIVWFFLASNILVSLAVLPALNNGLDVLSLAECWSHDPLALIDLRQVMTNERAGVESSVAEVSRLEECVCAAEEDAELLRLARARVVKLMAERALLTAKTEQVNSECEALAACICELEVAAATHTKER